MKVLGLSCSPRATGNTVTLLNEALKGAQQKGAEVELYSLSGKDVRSCDACRECRETGVCRVKDDMQPLYGKLLEADGIIFGAPVYFYGMASQAKAVIDRTTAMSRPDQSLANKVGGVIVTGGSLGLVDVLKDFYFYMATRQIIPANFVAAYGDAKTKEKGLKAAFDLGRQMARIAAQGFRYPSEFPRSGFAYGTHTH